MRQGVIKQTSAFLEITRFTSHVAEQANRFSFYEIYRHMDP